MKLTCTVSRQAKDKWLARHTGSSTGQVEVTAPTRDEALTKMRNELQYRIEWCPYIGASGDTVELQVWASEPLVRQKRQRRGPAFRSNPRRSWRSCLRTSPVR